MVTCLGTIEKMIAVIPDGEPLKTALQEFHKSVFLELPESNYHLWANVATILGANIPRDENQRNPWQQEAVRIFMDAQDQRVAEANAIREQESS